MSDKDNNLIHDEAKRAHFEKWCARKWGVVSSFVKGRYLDLDDQDRWEAYAAGAADENEACAKIADDFIEANPHSSLPSQIAEAIRARQVCTCWKVGDDPRTYEKRSITCFIHGQEQRKEKP